MVKGMNIKVRHGINNKLLLLRESKDTKYIVFVYYVCCMFVSNTVQGYWHISCGKTCVLLVELVVIKDQGYTFSNSGSNQLLREAVADLEGVPWVPWNSSFEGLLLKVLCANMRSHTGTPLFKILLCG